MVNFQAALKQVTRAQVKTGLLQNQLDAATEAAEVQKTNVELQRSNLLDTDLATATASLVKSNALLQAAQSVMTKLDVNTLFQKL
jgi:flagellin-like hook-associated protein FlgL